MEPNHLIHHSVARIGVFIHDDVKRPGEVREILQCIFFLRTIIVESSKRAPEFITRAAQHPLVAEYSKIGEECALQQTPEHRRILELHLPFDLKPLVETRLKIAIAEKAR